jgi:rod shape-determining protein MreC
MARTTPTHTPPFKYILACLLSIALLFSDLRYETFSLFRGSVQAVGIYSQLFLESFTSKLLVFTYLYEDKKTLVRSNSKLRDQLQEIENKQFLKKQNQRIAIDIINMQDRIKDLGNKRQVHVLKIASFGLKNYLCCSQHILNLQNPRQFDIASNLPVAANKTFIGQTSQNHLNLIEVILFSDVSHILPVKINGLHCNAQGAGKPMLARCKVNEDFKISSIYKNINVMTSGMGGIFPKDVRIGTVLSIVEVSSNEFEIEIALDGNPMDHNYFGILVSS